jgi:hypothetical protein
MAVTHFCAPRPEDSGKAALIREDKTMDMSNENESSRSSY